MAPIGGYIALTSGFSKDAHSGPIVLQTPSKFPTSCHGTKS